MALVLPRATALAILVPRMRPEGNMADDLSNRGAADRARINVNEPHEVRYWCKQLGCTEAELRAAVQRAGVMADDVRRALGK
jgi:hypothetical protein